MQIRQHDDCHANNAKHPTNVHARTDGYLKRLADTQRRYHHLERKNQRHHRRAAVNGGVIQQQIAEGEAAQAKAHHRAQQLAWQHLSLRTDFPPIQRKKQPKRDCRTVKQRHFQRIFRALYLHGNEIQTPNQHASQVHQGIQNRSVPTAVVVSGESLYGCANTV